MASSYGEFARAVRAVHGKAGQCAPECLPGQVQDHARERDDARKERGQGDRRTNMASTRGREGVDQQRRQEEIGDAAEQRRKEGDGSINAGLGGRGSGRGKRMRRDPARNKDVHETRCAFPSSG